jgi:hypothetical protein
MKTLTASEIEPLLATIPLLPPTPALEDRAAWKRFRERSDILAEAKRAVAVPAPPLVASIYLRTSRDGNRTAFQDISFGRRSRLATLVLATAASEDDALLVPLVDVWMAILEESTWFHPAHDLSLDEYRGVGRGIDLMAAETGFLLAESLAILGERLPDFVRSRTRAAIEERIFSRYLSDAEKEYPWRDGRNNWTAVCTGCIAGAALYLMDDRHRLAALLERVLASLDLYIRNAFHSDGASDEGVGYWNYGFGHYVMAADLLRRATESRIDLLDDVKVRSIAVFPTEVQLLPGLFPAFADCPREVKIGPWLSGYLAEETGQRGWVAYARDVAGTRTRGFWYRDAFPPEPRRAKPLPLPRVTCFPDTQLWIARAKEFVVAAKGGHNAENHNHNDLGSFMLVVDGEVLAADIGAPIYTRDTFSEHRYENPAIGSWGHSVPMIGGCPQREGRDAAARIIDQEEKDGASVFSLDLTAAYPSEAGITSLVREFRLQRGSRPSLVVTDRFGWNGEKKGWEESIVTFAPVGQVENGVILRGPKRQLRIECSVPVEIEVKSVRVDTHDGVTPLRICFRPEDPVTDTCEIRFIPGK